MKNLPRLLSIATLVGAASAPSLVGLADAEAAPGKNCSVAKTQKAICGAPCDPYDVDYDWYFTGLFGLGDYGNLTIERTNPCSCCNRSDCSVLSVTQYNTAGCS
jgi:hypothetical protein